ncbi:hypothetical protein GCM10010324_61410 [Streptomyces hiroshimensis]|uniref:Uncharacterized protein n=1 Tax=Streptomyces hiroshimensis TaxID=66424 RepID=A0ABQ2Z7M9_9ACTN|nr:hypothetical protein GCM10010324_61410 [Streptomyces hiroshimensis]
MRASAPKRILQSTAGRPRCRAAGETGEAGGAVTADGAEEPVELEEPELAVVRMTIRMAAPTP